MYKKFTDNIIMNMNMNMNNSSEYDSDITPDQTMIITTNDEERPLMNVDQWAN